MHYTDQPFWLLPFVHCLSMARLIGCAVFLSLFSARHMAHLERTAICFALALPLTNILWSQVASHEVQPLLLTMLSFKEVLLGLLLGSLLSLPFWAIRSAWSLIDNQRGANAAQQTNPSLEADASVLGELAERAFIVFLIEAGALVFLFDTIFKSYQIWPATSWMPEFSYAVRKEVLAVFAQTIAHSLQLAAPVLLILLLVEYGLSIVSVAGQGLDVYSMAMPIKSLLSLVVMSMYVSGLFDNLYKEAVQWWLDSMLYAFELV